MESCRACVAPIAHDFRVRGGYLSASFRGGGQTIGFRAMRRERRSLSVQGMVYEHSTKERDLHLIQDWINIDAHIRNTYACIIGLICLFTMFCCQWLIVTTTRANQTLSAASHAIPAYKSDVGLKYDLKIELCISEC